MGDISQGGVQVITGQQDFKMAARRFASGVTVVTTRLDDDTVHGLTVSSFASLSLNPLLVTVSLLAESRMLEFVRRSGHFAISILAEHQQDVSGYFSQRGREPQVSMFEGIASDVQVTGAPVIADAAAYFDCTVHEIIPGGDHEILVGSVVASGGSQAKPLLYFDGGYRSLPDLADSMQVQVRLAGLEAEEIAQTQTALDPAVAALAAEHATDEDIRVLRALLDEESAAFDDQERFTALGMQFHVAIAQASGNRFLHASLEAMRRERQALFAPRNEVAKAQRSHDFHCRVVEAIEARDPEAARAVMAAHVGVIGERLRAG
ncbi:MAG: flavin reductase [Actinobacteria bacterium]|nr:flavin reductase [Actinomycetota bacterium]